MSSLVVVSVSMKTEDERFSIYLTLIHQHADEFSSDPKPNIHQFRPTETSCNLCHVILIIQVPHDPASSGNLEQTINVIESFGLPPGLSEAAIEVANILYSADLEAVPPTPLVVAFQSSVVLSIPLETISDMLFSVRMPPPLINIVSNIISVLRNCDPSSLPDEPPSIIIIESDNFLNHEASEDLNRIINSQTLEDLIPALLFLIMSIRSKSGESVSSIQTEEERKEFEDQD